MDYTSLADLTVGELADLVQRGGATSREVVDACLARVDALGPRLNAHVLVLREQARAAAEVADRERAAGHTRGPLQGVPLGVKDLFDVAGVPRTAGSLILRDEVPSEDATVVRRLKDQGAIILTKDNLHEFAFGTTGENPHLGAARNPWDLERIAGGSSSGTAAAVSARLVPAGLGTDTGGSVRIPASLCGITGMKPTFGAVSRAGVWPLALSMDHVGVLARSVEDCALVLQAIAGPDPLDPTVSLGPAPGITSSSSSHRGLGGSKNPQGEEPSPPFRGNAEDHRPPPLRGGFGGWEDLDLRGLRLGLAREAVFGAAESGVVDAVEKALGVLRDLGAQIVEVEIPHVERAQEIGLTNMAVEAVGRHATWLRTRPDDYGPDVRARLQAGAEITDATYQEAVRQRALLREGFAQVFETVDLLVGPTVGLVAPRIGTTFDPVGPGGLPPRSLLNRLTVPANLAGLPAISVPCGLVSGLPVGLHVVGAPWSDERVMHAAAAYQHATDWHLRRPSLLGAP